MSSVKHLAILLIVSFSSDAGPPCLQISEELVRCYQQGAKGEFLGIEERTENLLSPIRALYLKNGQIFASMDWPAKIFSLWQDNRQKEFLQKEQYQSYQNAHSHVSCEGLQCRGPYPPKAPRPELLRDGDLVFTASYSPYSGRSLALFTHAGIVRKKGGILRVLSNDIMEEISPETFEDAFLNVYSYLILRDVRFRQALEESREDLKLQEACTLLVSRILQTKFSFQPKNIFEALYPEILAEGAARSMQMVAGEIPGYETPQEWLQSGARSRTRKFLQDWEKIRQNPGHYMLSLFETELPLQPLLFHPARVDGLFRFIALQEALGLTGTDKGARPGRKP